VSDRRRPRSASSAPARAGARSRSAPPAPEGPEGPESSESPEGLDAAAWGEFLSQALEAPVQVVFTRARRTVLRLEPRGRERTVRMNAFFAGAPAEVREAVLAWIRSGRRARAKLERLDAWIETQIEIVEQTAPRPVIQRTRGRVHDLARLAAEVRAQEFPSTFEQDGGPAWPKLTWGRAPRSRSRRTLRLGSFDFWAGVVRMHPVLDQPAVPEHFVRYVLFHELLHAALPAERGRSGRRVYHSREFRRREHAFGGTAAALAWEQSHLGELLWSARTGQDMRIPAAASPRLAPGRAVAAHEVRLSEPAEPGLLRRLVQRLLF